MKIKQWINEPIALSRRLTLGLVILAVVLLIFVFLPKDSFEKILSMAISPTSTPFLSDTDTPTPSDEPSDTPQPEEQTQTYQQPAQAPTLIDCVGPNNTHYHVTQAACDFAWSHMQTQPVQQQQVNIPLPQGVNSAQQYQSLPVHAPPAIQPPPAVQQIQPINQPQSNYQTQPVPTKTCTVVWQGGVQVPGCY